MQKWFKKAFLTLNIYEIQLSQDLNWQNREHFHFAIFKHFHYCARLHCREMESTHVKMVKNALKTFLTRNADSFIIV